MKKLMAAILCASMVVGLFPTAVTAAGKESAEGNPQVSVREDASEELAGNMLQENSEESGLSSMAREIAESGNHYKATGIYSNSWTDIPDAPTGNHTRDWREGMISGNGENGVITSSAPYKDTLIFQYMYNNFPSSQPIEAPEDEYTYLDEARQAVYNLDDTWNVHGRNRTFYYAYHPSGQLSLDLEHQGTVSDYERWTDYETAEVGVDFTDENGSWERRTFTSRADNVTITSIQSSSTGKTIDMTLSVDDISAMSQAYNGMSPVGGLRYKKLVADDCSYIGEVVKYPSYANSDLKYGGYSTMTYVIVEGGNKEKILLAESDDSGRSLKESTLNVGQEKNPAIKITDADAVYLITKSNRDADMCSFKTFEGKTRYDLVDSLVGAGKAVAEKQAYRNSDGTFSYEKALAPHAKLHGDAFNAAKFTLDGDEEDKGLSTDELLQKQRNDKSRLNHALLEKAWYAGRYAQLCASGICAYRLCGMWTGEFNGGWRYIFTLDANVNLQVSAMNTNNMPYGTMGYITFFLKLADDFRVNAECSYGMHDAIQVSVNSDGDHGQSVEYDKYYPFQYWNAGASWCLLPIYEYWQCYGNQQIPISDLVDFHKLKSVLSMKDEDGDGYYEDLTDAEIDAMLAKGYLDLEKDILLPLLTKQANFWEQLVTPEYYMDRDGKARYTKGKTSLEPGEKYMIIPTYSPENNPIGYTSTITANATMDIAAARDGLNMTIEMEKAVGRRGCEQAIAKWENLIKLLPDYKYDNTVGGQGGGGALREWAMDEYTENNNHRHVSHLYVAWPGYETKEDEVIKAGAIQSLVNRERYNTGDATTGHGWVHRALTYARVEDGDGALNSLKPLITNYVFYSSMMTDHNSDRGSNTYCTDTSMGYVGTINEMVLFSNTGKIQLCPALGSDWTSGSMDGLRARTQAEVEKLSWNTQKGTVSTQIRSDIDQTIELTSNVPWKQAVVSGANAQVKDGESITLTMKAGDVVNVDFYDDVADKSSLHTAIESAESKLNSHKETDSNYVASANSQYASAILAAKSVYDNVSASSSDIRKSLLSLKAAGEEFDAAYDSSLSLGLTDGIYTSRPFFSVNYSGSDKLEIHYTTDGSEPTKDSPVLSGSWGLPRGVSVMKAALFIKESQVKISDTVSGKYMYLKGANAAQNQKITSSLANYGSSMDAAKAVDGNATTRWAVKGDSSTYEAEIDFGKETALNSIYLDEYTEVVDSEKNRIQSFELYYHTGGQYQLAYSFDGHNSLKDTELVVYDTTKSGHAKYAAIFNEVKTNKVKFVCKAAKEISIWELQMFQLKEAVPTDSLEAVLAEAGKLKKEEYTQESWQALQTAIDKAKRAIKYDTIESEEEAAKLEAGVRTAIGALKKAEVPKKQATIKGTAKYGKVYGAKAFQLNASCKAATDGKLSYVSNNPGVATVSSKGKVSVKATGRAVITVKLVSDAYTAKSYQVTIDVKPPKVTIASLKSKKKNQAMVSWKKLSAKQKITGYQIAYGTKKNVKSAKSVNVKQALSSKTINKLKSKKNCYVWIRAYKKVGKTTLYGAWSKPKAVKIK